MAIFLKKYFYLSYLLLFLDLISLIDTTQEISFNRPNICSNAMWNSPIRFPNSTTNIDNPFGLFITSYDVVYVIGNQQKIIHVFNGSAQFNIPLDQNFNNFRNVFVTSDNTIYISREGNPSLYRSMPTSYQWSSVFTENPEKNCEEFFISINENIYCSVKNEHRVIRVPISNPTASPELVAGGKGAGKAADQLSNPRGIFVHRNLTLYVADSGNNRIQRFLPNETNGTTVLGADTPPHILIKTPIAVMLDANDHLFVLQQENAGIIAQTSSGWHCPQTQDTLKQVKSFRFDSMGNIFIIDPGKQAIFKLEYMNQSCDSSNDSSSTTATETASIVRSECPSATTSTSLSSTATSSSSSTTMITSASSATTSVTDAVIKTQKSTGVMSLSSTIMSVTVASSAVPSMCTLFKPCRNGGTCIDQQSCPCSEGADEIECKRHCKYSWEYFKCVCTEHWQGYLCETKINYCHNITCQNKGYCQSTVGNWTCLCNGNNYFGRYCQHTSQKILIKKIITKSISYIAILAMITVALFVIIMDILKYCCGIDPVAEDREAIQQEKLKKTLKEISPKLKKSKPVESPV